MQAATSADARAEGTRRAIAASGTAVELARKVDVTKAAVQQWKVRGIPADRVADVSRATGIPKHELRPDLFDAPGDAAGAGAGHPEPVQPEHAA